ncbi:MAG TPA: hypothetical protein VD997_05145 [Phycisphaerales bacterium]|nr:hypothetical protein [Phycisphaerales bacterium]
MGTVKPWQIVVMVLAVVAVIGSVVYSCSGESTAPPEQAREVTLVDIRTGDLFIADYPERRPVMFPAKNPDDQQMTLYPVNEKDGKWMLNMRYMSQIRKEKGLKADLLSDQQSGTVNVTNPTPRRANVFE